MDEGAAVETTLSSGLQQVAAEQLGDVLDHLPLVAGQLRPLADDGDIDVADLRHRRQRGPDFGLQLVLVGSDRGHQLDRQRHVRAVDLDLGHHLELDQALPDLRLVHPGQNAQHLLAGDAVRSVFRSCHAWHPLSYAPPGFI